MNDGSALDERLKTARSAIVALPASNPPDIAATARRQSRRRTVLVSVMGACALVGAIVVTGFNRETTESAADANGVGTKIGDTPWRLMLMPTDWTSTLVDDDTTAITSPEGQTVEISADPEVWPPTDTMVVVGPLADGYSTGTSVYVERMGWTLEVGVPGGGAIDPDIAVWLLQSIGRVDLVSPFPTTPLPAEIPDVVGMDYEEATEVLLAAGVRAEWIPRFQGVPGSPIKPIGTVVEIRRTDTRVLMDVATPPLDFEQASRYQGGFFPDSDAFLSSRWSLRQPLKGPMPRVFLRGEIVGTYEAAGTNSVNVSVRIQDTGSMSRSPAPAEEVVETATPAEVSVSPDVRADLIEDAPVTFQGLALVSLPDGWKLVDRSAEIRDGGLGWCPEDRTVLVRPRSVHDVVADCTRGFGQTMPENWFVIEPLPDSVVASGGIRCKPSLESVEDGPRIFSCPSTITFPTGFAPDGTMQLVSGQKQVFDGYDVLITSGGASAIPHIVYADGHSASDEQAFLDVAAVAIENLGELHQGGGGCASLAEHAEPDFSMESCMALGPVSGTSGAGRTELAGSVPGDAMSTNINPQPDASGTMIVLDDEGDRVPYLLAHRFSWNPVTLAGEWRIASIERYTGTWPPPAQLPGRPPAPTTP